MTVSSVWRTVRYVTLDGGGYVFARRSTRRRYRYRHRCRLDLLGNHLWRHLVAESLTARRRHASKTHAKTPAERRARRREALKRYAQSPRGKYKQQRDNAKARGIPWELTFPQWCEIWEESGHWDERGNFDEGYVMARNGDQGPYAVGNVRIARHVENVAERNRWYFAARRWREPSDPDYEHVHSAPDVDSSKFNGEPGPDVPF